MSKNLIAGKLIAKKCYLIFEAKYFVTADLSLFLLKIGMSN